MRLGFLSMGAGLCLLVALGAAPACSTDAIIDDGEGGSGAGTGQGGSACLEQELCNTVDDDCDGVVDEDCACVEGQTQACYEGPAGTEGIGSCAPGQQTCSLQGTWGACEGSVVPTDEVCNGADDDCDADTDEELNATITCGLGICQATVDTCVGGVANPCLPGDPNPGGETCDGFDDDCDGTIDEGCDCINGNTQPCYSGAPNTQGVGLCTAGVQTCVQGAWGACVGEVLPTAELCNGQDDNCDNVPDDNDPQGGGACSTGLAGICNPGTQHCVGGTLVCQQNNQPTAEVCNNLDDDCNGTPDDGNPGGGGPCSTGLPGICTAGTLMCTGGLLVCQQNQMAEPAEICQNNLDDDCNGMADDGCPCPTNQQNCDGNLVGNGCECVGTGCCGTSCQTQHSNGQGQNFHDCNALGTHDVNQAFAACAASTGDPAQCSDLGVVCDTDLDLTDDSAVVCSTGAADCICWAYSGPAAGYTYNNPGDTGCFCALPGDPSWN